MIGLGVFGIWAAVVAILWMFKDDQNIDSAAMIVWVMIFAIIATGTLVGIG